MAPLPLNADCATRIGDVLRRVGYTQAAVSEMLGLSPLPLGSISPAAPARRRTSGGSALETVIRLFVLGMEIDDAVLAGAVAPTSVEDWCAAGLVERLDGRVRAAVSVRPRGDVLVAADHPRAPGTQFPLDWVMGLSPSTLALARMTVRRPVRAVLDVGTGGGYQAVLAAGHAERVVATDVNPRAMSMARLTAALNDVGAIEFRQGDLFEPAAGETFDLIVSNPPFIIGLDIDHQFLSGSRPGDGLCRELASGAPSLLTEGGYCQFLANWASVGGEPWVERLGDWFEDNGCDVWVIRVSADAPDVYASTWIAAVTDDTDEYYRRFDDWMRWFDAERVDGIGYGLVTMRKRTTGPANWRRFDDVGDAFETGSGSDIERLVEARTWLESMGHEALLQSRFRIADETRALLRMADNRGTWETEELVLRRVEGLSFGTATSPDVLRLVSACDGAKRLGDVIDSLTPEGADSQAVASEIEESVREMVAVGLLATVPER